MELGMLTSQTSPYPSARTREWTFESRDPDAAQAHLEGIFGPHAMELHEGTGEFCTRQRSDDIHGICVHYLGYGGATVGIRPEPMDDRVVVVQPLQGKVGVSEGAVGIVASSRLPAVLDTGKRYRTHWGRHVLARKVSFDRNLVKDVAADLSGLARHQVVVDFNLQSPASPSAVTAWNQLVGLLAVQTLHQDRQQIGPAALFHLTTATVAALLETYPAAVRQIADLPHSSATARVTKHAIAYIEDNAAGALRLHDIAHAVGLSPRALQLAFRRHHGTTPMEFLRNVRLRRAHAELAAADPSQTTVAGVAARWGFYNPGRFACEFRSMFGQYPKEVLCGH